MGGCPQKIECDDWGDKPLIPQICCWHDAFHKDNDALLSPLLNPLEGSTV
jgi:hypothetical protein